MDKIEEFALFQAFKAYSSSVYGGRIEVLPGKYLEGETFTKFISIDLTGDLFEIPALYVLPALHVRNLGYDKLVIPLDLSSTSFKKISMASSILYSVGAFTHSNGLLKIITSKENIYYGNRGIILDENFNPLFLTTYVIEKADTNSYKVRQVNCRVPHEVFQRQDEVIPKTIYKKLIPLYGVSTFQIPYIPGPGNFINFSAVNKVQVIIGEMPEIIVNSNTPEPSSATDEEFARILRDNIDSFL